MRKATAISEGQESAFRDSPSVIASEADKLAALRQAELSNRPKGWGTIFVKRRSRIAFGVAGSLGAVLTMLAILTVSKISVVVLVASWPFAFLVSRITDHIAAAYLRQHVASIDYTNDDPYSRLAQLRETSVAKIEYELSRRYERASLVWPLIAVALLAPMTLVMLGCGVLFTNGFGFMFTQDLKAAAELMGYLALATAASHFFFAASTLQYATERRSKPGILQAAVAAVASTVLLSLYLISPTEVSGGNWSGVVLVGLILSVIIAGIVAIVAWIVSIAGFRYFAKTLDRELVQLQNYSE